MSIAPPLLPPPPISFTNMSGHGSARASIDENGTSAHTGAGRSPQVYPHILDLQAKAQARINNLNPHMTVGLLLRRTSKVRLQRRADTGSR